MTIFSSMRVANIATTSIRCAFRPLYSTARVLSHGSITWNLTRRHIMTKPIPPKQSANSNDSVSTSSQTTKGPPLPDGVWLGWFFAICCSLVYWLKLVSDNHYYAVRTAALKEIGENSRDALNK